jgi:hypothetical protein
MKPSARSAHSASSALCARFATHQIGLQSEAPANKPVAAWRPASACILVCLASLFSACASRPVPPDWQANAHGALKDFSAAYLTGNSRVANLEFVRARNAIAGTGRADLIARAELVRCANRIASLEFDNCADLAGLADDVGPSEKAYAAFLNGVWQGLDSAALPAQHRALVSAGSESARNSVLLGLQDPLAQLVAAGVLFRMGQLAPAGVAAAVNTASEQGWRRPLLAWLGVLAKRAEAAGDTDAKSRIQRRIDIVTGSAAAGS